MTPDNHLHHSNILQKEPDAKELESAVTEAKALYFLF